MRRAVLFDLMDTVLRDPYREALRAATGLELREIGAARNPEVWPRFEKGHIDEATFAAGYFREGTGHTFDMKAFHAERRAGYAFLPGMRELVVDLREAGVGLYVASNYPVWIEEVRETFALDALFDGVVASHHVGARKPEAAFYEALFARVPCPPAACLFVDDRADNCTGAEAHGASSHVFSSADDLRARLVRDGFLPG